MKDIRDENGSVTVLAAIFTVFMILLLSLTLMLGAVYGRHMELQTAADSAAWYLAGMLPAEDWDLQGLENSAGVLIYANLSSAADISIEWYSAADVRITLSSGTPIGGRTLSATVEAIPGGIRP